MDHRGRNPVARFRFRVGTRDCVAPLDFPLETMPDQRGFFISSRVTSLVIFSCPRITVTITFSPSE
jgi:hypothetical protein